MTSKNTPVAAVENISTKAELDKLLAARPKPRTELQLTIEGWQEQEVHTHVNQLSETRIQNLKTRLDQAKNGFKRDHLHSQLRGKASNDFDRNR